MRDWPVEARRLWDDICSTWIIDDGYGRERLTTACNFKADEVRAEAVVAEHGILIEGLGGKLRENPACRAVAAARNGCLRALRELHLDIELPARVGRPAKGL